jgi:N-6 DNA Methylase
MTPQQQEANNTIREALSPFGYEPPHVRFGCRVPNAEEMLRYTREDRGELDNLPCGNARRLDALAFSDDRTQDWNTSAIAIDLEQDSAVGTEASREHAKELFRLTAAPTNVVGGLSLRKVDVWFNCHDGIVGPETVTLAPDPLKAVFQRHRSSVQRDLLAHLRAGQHHLFEGQLYARRDELATFLQRGVSKATWVVGVGDDPWGNTKKQIATMRTAFSRVALALLAARILEDKGALGERTQSTDARQLLTEAKTKWDAFFDTVLGQDLARLDAHFQPKHVNRMLRYLLSHLTGPVNFALVTHEMLGDLYEQVQFAERSASDDALVELKGVHYTPLAIARRILDRIPLEDLPVRYRTVCDFACGSGSFLLAATDRLAKLFDPREPDAMADRTEWLREAVMGNDIDPVAVLVAKLSYLIAYWNRLDEKNGVPFPNLHERGNALNLDFGKAFGRTPNVIVGNPPFGVKGQPASMFLDRALSTLLSKVKPVPGYIGIVMPGAFLKAKLEQEAVRTKLLQHARILEVWELPQCAIGLFARTPTCVIIAEVSDGKPVPEQFVRTCQTISAQKKALSALRDHGISTWCYVTDLKPTSTGEDAQDTLALSPVDDIWSRLQAQGRVVSEVAKAVWGFTHTNGDPDPEFSPIPGPDFVPCIRLQRTLRPYSITEDDWQASQPDENRFWKRGTGRRPAK